MTRHKLSCHAPAGSCTCGADARAAQREQAARAKVCAAALAGVDDPVAWVARARRIEAVAVEAVHELANVALPLSVAGDPRAQRLYDLARDLRTALETP